MHEHMYMPKLEKFLIPYYYKYVLM